MPELTINGIEVKVPDGTTILEAARRIGVRIPTLCHLDGLQSIGACRICVVEVEGAKTLIASCVAPVTDGMKVRTNTRRVHEARRSVIELLLSEHGGDCLTCDRSEDCELRALAHELGVRNIRYEGEKRKTIIDESTPALVRDSSKCILCRRCVTVCSERQGVAAIFAQDRGFRTTIAPAFGAPLSDVACVQCGQCSAVCPTGAITERDDVDRVWKALENRNNLVIVQTAPAIRAALGEGFGLPPGSLVTGKMVLALRRLGFDWVFDTEFAADLTIMEEGTELLSRLKRKLVEKDPDVRLPLFTSCCPSWIKFAEYYYPQFLGNISTCKSPQQMFGSAAKTYFARKVAKHPKDIVIVSVMPCTAKKFEALRPEMRDSWAQDVDIVLTTRELVKMIKQAGIDFETLPDGVMDAPLGLATGAADIFANTGGVMEAALRTAYQIVTGRLLPYDNLRVAPIEGMKGIKMLDIKVEDTLPDWSFLDGQTLSVAVVHELANAGHILDLIDSGEKSFHFVEVMTCPSGCIGGGGQPRFATKEVLRARMEAIFKEDEWKEMRMSHENPDVAKIYKEFFEKPLSETSHTFLHTKYAPRERV